MTFYQVDLVEKVRMLYLLSVIPFTVTRQASSFPHLCLYLPNQFFQPFWSTPCLKMTQEPQHGILFLFFLLGNESLINIVGFVVVNKSDY